MKNILLLLFICIIFTSCQNMVKPKSVSSAGELENNQILDLEEKIYALRYDQQADSRQKIITELRKYAENLRRYMTLNKDYNASVYALSGEIELLDKKNDIALEFLKTAENENPASYRVTILKIHVENDLKKKQALINKALKSNSGSGQLILEKGLADYEAKRYREAAAGLDEALQKLSPGYRDIFGKILDYSFKMKDVSPDQTVMEWLNHPVLTIEGMIALTSSETSWLELTAGDSYEIIFAKAKDKGFLPQFLIDINRPAERKFAAYFLYHILSFKENNSDMLTEYSSRYKTNAQEGNAAKSPVPDLNLDDPWFDSALGLVEREVFDLPDGINFKPDKTLSGVEYNEILGRMKKIAPK